MCKRTSHNFALDDYSQSATVSLEKEYIPPVERPRKCQHRTSSVGGTEPSIKLIPTTPRKAKLGRCNKSEAHLSSEMVFFNDIQRDALLVGCTAEASFETKVLLDRDHDAKMTLKISILCVVNKPMSVSAFL